MNANYVFARDLTSLTDIAEPIANLTFNRSYDWGDSNIGFKNKITGRINYELPFGKGATGFMDHYRRVAVERSCFLAVR